MTAVNPVPPPSPIRPPATPQEARAQAKAAKAHAKALRPWYRKKRWWALGLIAVIVAISVASAQTEKENQVTFNQPAIDRGIGSQDASADVKVVSLSAPDILGFRTAELLITNNSSKRSNYYIELTLESPDGKTQYDSTNATARNVEPGQSTGGSVVPFTKAKSAPAPTTAAAPVVKIKSVSRTAA